MKIIIATGIFKPELGGPATFAAEIGERLMAAGHHVTLVTYAPVLTDADGTNFSFPIVRVKRRRNKLSNYARYFWQLWRLTGRASRPDSVYLLDWFSAGVPAAAVCRLRGIPYIVRVGGGYIWEKYLSQGRPPMTLKSFYERGIYREYQHLFILIGWVLRGARMVIFNSNEQRLLFETYYKLPALRTQTIYNVAPNHDVAAATAPIALENRQHEIVFAGRLIIMKNIDSLVRAFARLRDTSFILTIIGEGPEEGRLRQLVDTLGLQSRVRFLPAQSQTQLYQKIRACYLVVIPSWTDISPHQMYECVAADIPCLITQENYLPFASSDFLKINPASVDDIAEKLNRLLDPIEYQAFAASLRKCMPHWTWKDVLVAHERVLAQIT